MKGEPSMHGHSEGGMRIMLDQARLTNHVRNEIDCVKRLRI